MSGASLGSVRVVGTGLIGTSVGLALRSAGVQVTLDDPSPTACALARDLGAGVPAGPGETEPDLVVVAAPPDVAGRVVVAELAAHPRAVVTDVASVKWSVLEDVRRGGGDLSRYVGGHPMAGRERSGAIAGRGDLFQGRPWVVVPHEACGDEAVSLVTELARSTGASPVVMGARAHDEAVAAVSHVPQMAASLVAAQLRHLPTEAVGLAGQGLRDVTRIAASDPALWTQIFVGNAGAVADVLTRIQTSLGEAIDALRLAEDQRTSGAPGARSTLAAVVADGNAGQARIPGKHGADPTSYAVVTVLVPDEPGALGRLFEAVGAEGVNIEDVRLDHAVGRLVGVVDLSVLPAHAEPLRAGLCARGWQLAE